MNINPINTLSYKSVNFLGAKKSPVSRAISASDKAMSQDAGLEMLALINSATMLSKKNDTTLKNEFEKMQAGLSILQGMKGDEKAICVTADILDTNSKYDENKELIEAQIPNLKEHLALLPDFLESESFIEFKKKADETRAIAGENYGVDVEENGITGTVYLGGKRGDFVKVAETDNNPEFDYYFKTEKRDARAVVVKRYEDFHERYTYTLNDKEKADNNIPVAVRRIDAKGQGRYSCMHYVWKKGKSGITVMPSGITKQ